MANLLQKTSNQIRRIYLSPTNLAMSSSNRNYKVTCEAIYISAEMRQLMVQEAHIYQSLFNNPGQPAILPVELLDDRRQPGFHTVYESPK